MNTQEILTSETKAALSYKSRWEHIWCILGNRRSLLALFGWALATFGILMTALEAGSYFLGYGLHGWIPFALVVAIAIVVASARAAYSYLHGCPPGLEAESAESRRIAQLQPVKWEFRLARQLLKERLASLDLELDNVLAGRTFVAILRKPDVDDYVAWMRTRPDNVLRLIEVANRLLVVEFLPALVARDRGPADPVRIVEVVDLIRKVYEDTVEFEKENRTVQPPEELESLHALQAGWTAPVRDAVHQLFGLIDEVIDVDPEKTESLEFTIKFESPENVERFNEELDRLKRIGVLASHDS